MMQNFPNLMREKVTQIQETQRVSIQRNPERPTSRHIIIKMAKFQDKQRILKAAREKQEVTYKVARIRLAADFSMKTLKQSIRWTIINKTNKQAKYNERYREPFLVWEM